MNSSDSDSIVISEELSKAPLQNLPPSARLLYYQLRDEGPCTQSDLIGSVGPRSTVHNALSALRKHGILIEYPTPKARLHSEYRVDPGQLRDPSS